MITILQNQNWNGYFWVYETSPAAVHLCDRLRLSPHKGQFNIFMMDYSRMTESSKDFIKKIPVVRFIARIGYYAFIELFNSFPGSKQYWEKRYELGGSSGAGSYKELAEFKTNIINLFVEKKGIKTVIEYGCGDGNQLKLADYPSYVGFDISTEAISCCKKNSQMIRQRVLN